MCGGGVGVGTLVDQGYWNSIGFSQIIWLFETLAASSGSEKSLQTVVFIELFMTSISPLIVNNNNYSQNVFFLVLYQNIPIIMILQKLKWNTVQKQDQEKDA